MSKRWRRNSNKILKSPGNKMSKQIESNRKLIKLDEIQNEKKMTMTKNSLSYRYSDSDRDPNN